MMRLFIIVVVLFSALVVGQHEAAGDQWMQAGSNPYIEPHYRGYVCSDCTELYAVACPNWLWLFTVNLEPFHNAYEFSWTGVDTSEDYINQYGNSTGFKTFSSVGTATITCEAHNITLDTYETYTFNVDIKPYAPECPPDDPSSTVGCSADTIGGSGCSSCGSGDDVFPLPSIRKPIVYYPFGGGRMGGPGLDGGDTGSGDDSGSGTCRAGTLEVVDTCTGLYLRVIDGCGKCAISYIPGDTSENPVEITHTNGLEDGTVVVSTITPISGTKSFNTTHAMTLPDGTVRTYSFGPPTSSKGWTTSPVGPSSIVTPQGMTTTFNRDSNGALESVVLPDGSTWTYGHDNDDTKITSVTAPDGTYAEVQYVESGNAVGKQESVTIYTDSSKTTEVSSVSYSYYTDGRVDTVTKSDRSVKYQYDDTNRKITVTELSASPVMRTVYSYGSVGSSTTTVTKQAGENPDSNVDQTTTYTFVMDGNNKTWLSSVEDPMGNTTTYEYNGGRLEQITDPTGIKIEYTYNTKGAVLTAITSKPDDTVLSAEEYTYYLDTGYNDTIWVKTHKDVRGNYTYYECDTTDLPNNLWKVLSIKVSPPIGGFLPPTDQQWQSISPIKQYEYYTADGDNGKTGMLKKEIVPDIDGTTDNITEYRYGYGDTGTPYEWRNSPTETNYQWWDSGSSVYKWKTTYTTYDGMGRVLSTGDGSGTDRVDGSGTNDNGHKIWYEYDAESRQTKTIYAKDGSTPTIYTENNYGCCTLNWSADEEGNKTYYAYDGANRVIRVWTDISGQTGSTEQSTPLVAYTYDAFGNKATVTTRSDANTTRTTTYTYDKNNRVIKIVYPTVGGNRALDDEYFQYDSRGNLVAKLVGVVDAQDKITSGIVTAYEYDDLGRLKYVDENYSYTAGTTVWPLGSISVTADITYGYLENSVDKGSRLRTSMIDGSGTSSYEYDIQGRLSKYTPPVGLDTGYYVEYDYNNLGQKIYEKITNGTATNYDCRYEYYANGWLWKVKDGTSALATYSYDAVGNRTQVDNGNTTYTTYAYDSDPRYRLNTITHKKGANTLATIDYTSTARDRVGNPKAMTDWTGTWTYGYDDNNRLTSAVPPSPVPDQPAGGTYGYDWVGNRVRPPADPNPPSHTNEMVYNAVDQLTSWPGMRSYTYYPDGSLHEENAIINGQPTQIGHYTYHYSGLLDVATYATPGGNHTATNTWDADANRVQLVINGQTFKFVYDPTAGIPAVIEEQKTGGATVYYYREPNGALVARLQGSSSHYYHFDALGSTKLLTDGSGNVTDKYSYDAWGSLLWHKKGTGSADQPYQYVGQLGYFTHYQDPDFKLLQLGVRFYDSEIGRFTRRDPIRHGSNWYAYVDGRPIIHVDPLGLFGGFCDPKYKMLAKACNAFKTMEKCGKEMADAAIEEVAKLGLGGDYGGDRDAMRHCVWNCKMTKHCPPGTAGLVSREYERCNPDPYDPEAHREMDEHNNNEGRDCGNRVSGIGNSDCIHCCLHKLRNGGLITVW